MKEIKSILFNFTCDNPEEFRQEIDEIEDKDRLYELRSVLNDAKAILNQVRAFGDDELKEKIESFGFWWYSYFGYRGYASHREDESV